MKHAFISSCLSCMLCTHSSLFQCTTSYANIHYDHTYMTVHIPSLPTPARGRCRKSGGGKDLKGQSGRGRRGEQIPVRYDMYTTATPTTAVLCTCTRVLQYVPAYVHCIYYLSDTLYKLICIIIHIC